MPSPSLEEDTAAAIVAAPRRPQTLGKIERFWGTLWRECIESAIFLDLGDARRRSSACHSTRCRRQSNTAVIGNLIGIRCPRTCPKIIARRAEDHSSWVVCSAMVG